MKFILCDHPSIIEWTQTLIFDESFKPIKWEWMVPCFQSTGHWIDFNFFQFHDSVIYWLIFVGYSVFQIMRNEFRKKGLHKGASYKGEQRAGDQYRETWLSEGSNVRRSVSHGAQWRPSGSYQHHQQSTVTGATMYTIFYASMRSLLA